MQDVRKSRKFRKKLLLVLGQEKIILFMM